MTEADILFEKGPYWIARRTNGGLDIYKNGATHATRVAIVDFRLDPDRQMRKAKAEIDRRISVDQREIKQ